MFDPVLGSKEGFKLIGRGKASTTHPSEDYLCIGKKKLWNKKRISAQTTKETTLICARVVLLPKEGNYNGSLKFNFNSLITIDLLCEMSFEHL